MPDVLPDAFWIPLSCASCHGQVAVKLARWRTGIGPAFWSCPHCQARQQLPAFGQIVKVIAKQSD